MRIRYFLAPLLLLMFIVGTIQADSSYDKTSKPLNNSTEEQVRTVFKKLLSAYTDGSASEFFDHVSEKSFQHDYIGFEDALREDMRMNSILNIDYYFNKMVPSGKNKFFLFVQWEKLYQNIRADKPQTKRATSRFLFKRVKGTYKLIGMSGKLLFGDTRSRKEFKKDVPRRQADTSKNEHRKR